MAKVSMKVSRWASQQPQWAKNFFIDAGLDVEDSSKNAELVRCLIQDQQLIKSAKAKVKIVFGPFDPPVSLTVNRQSWTFTWDSEQEQIHFMLRW